MIDLRGVQRNFQLGDDHVHALRTLDLKIEQGDYVALMGPSGSGKSTLLNIIGLLDRPDAGHYLLDGRDVGSMPPDDRALIRRHKIGFVFQSFHLIPRLTAAQNVELPLILANMEDSQRQDRVNEVLRAVGLEDRARHRPDQLSGGQRQRVAIARAIIMRPQIILADEPTGNLDHSSGKVILETLDELNAGGITVIIVTHDPIVAEHARTRFRMMDGKLQHDGTG